MELTRDELGVVVTAVELILWPSPDNSVSSKVLPSFDSPIIRGAEPSRRTLTDLLRSCLPGLPSPRLRESATTADKAEENGVIKGPGVSRRVTEFLALDCGVRGVLRRRCSGVLSSAED